MGLVGSGSASTSYTVADVNALNTFNTSAANYRAAQPAVGGGSARDVYFEKGHFSVKGASNDSWDGYTGSYVNGGFMVLEPGVFDYIEGDDTVFEKAPLEQLAKDGQLMVYRHDGFWKCMDTQRDKMQLEQMWQEGNAPWKLWK